jgi:hypothetical protein
MVQRKMLESENIVQRKMLESENMVQRKMLEFERRKETGEWRILRNEELFDLYS